MNEKTENELEPVTVFSKPHTDFEENFLWAVSYSDMLMVLLCFFILFFSLDDEKKSTLIEVIASKVESVPSQKNLTVSNADDPKKTIPMTQILGTLKGINVNYDASKNSLSILLSDNVFDKGQYVLNKEGEKELFRIFELLLPFKDKIHLAFIGHTDNTPIGASRKTYLNNNFDLSSLRARHVLDKSIQNGFSEKNISLQAAAEHVRNSRTISITVTSHIKTSEGDVP